MHRDKDPFGNHGRDQESFFRDFNKQSDKMMGSFKRTAVVGGVVMAVVYVTMFAAACLIVKAVFF